jgi:polysulfide reductase-like protein
VIERRQDDGRVFKCTLCYDRLKDGMQPAWTIEVPWYFAFGGMAGASATLTLGARLAGNHRLARGAGTAAAAGIIVSVPLLVSDLGRPERFVNMLRVFKPASPMSLGSWVVAGFGPAAVGAAVAERLRITPRLAVSAEVVAGLLGLPMATYTAVLLANTAVPVWHEAGRELPLVFGGSAAASAGAAAALLTPAADAGPARRLALAGAALELGAGQVMERRLGELGEPYHHGAAGRYARLAKACTAAGAVTLGLAGRRRPVALAALVLLAGSAFERLAVFKAGFQSAADPRYVVGPQRERLTAPRPS